MSASSCACGQCPVCRHRAANRKWYAARHPEAAGKKAAQNLKWDRIYEVKFVDPSYYELRIPTPQSSFHLLADWAIGRGATRHTPAAPGCD